MAMLYEKHIRSIHQAWAEAIKFNHSLNIPVRWKRAAKAQYRAGKGFYDYTNARSSQHVLLLDDLQDGRLKRRRGQFLCGSKINNKRTHELINMNDLATTDQVVEKSKEMKVTCKRCLEVAKRFR